MKVPKMLPFHINDFLDFGLFEQCEKLISFERTHEKNLILGGS